MSSGLLRAYDLKEVSIIGLHLYDNGFAEIIFSDGHTMLLDRKVVFQNMGVLSKIAHTNFGVKWGGPNADLEI